MSSNNDEMDGGVDPVLAAMLANDAEEIAAAAPVVSLQAVQQAARAMHEAQVAVAEAEKDLKTKKEALRILEEVRLPELMDTAGVSSVSTPDGLVVTIESFMSASITEAKRPFVVQWLKDTENDELVKPELHMVFSKGELAEAQRIAAEMSTALGRPVEVLEAVNTTSFKALIAELRRESPDMSLPLDELGVYIGRKAKIKTSKAPKNALA